MTNNFKDRYKKPHLLLSWYYQYKNFDANKSKIDKKSYKIFLFTTLDIWQSKTWNMWNGK